MSKVIDRDSEVREVTISFITEVIEESIRRFDISFNELDTILDSLGYWEVFNNNNNEVTCAGAHNGIEEVLQEIGEFINRSN